MIDFHCHLLPGVDDGAESLAEGLAIARQLYEAGFTTVVATPHVLEGRVMLTPADIEQRAGEFNRALEDAGIALNVQPGAENHIFPAMAGYLREGRLLGAGGKGKYLLLELPAWEIPPYTEQVFFELKLAGVTPVLAHPERYPALWEAPGRLGQWLKLGVLLQIDLRSLSGRYGRLAQEWARELARGGFVHAVGSDAHRPSHRQNPYRDELDKLQSLAGDARFRAMTEDYPRRILLGEDLPSPAEDILREDPPKSRRKSWFRRSH